MAVNEVGELTSGGGTRAARGQLVHPPSPRLIQNFRKILKDCNKEVHNRTIRVLFNLSFFRGGGGGKTVLLGGRGH